MSEIKFKHPLEYYTVDNFIKDSCEMIGEPVKGILATSAHDIARYNFIVAYAHAIGDSNPLYTDVGYALETKYYGLISVPTYLVAIKYPMSEGALFEGPYPLVGLEAEYDWEWNDVIKMNDSFTTEHVIKDVYEKSSEKGRTVYIASKCKYLNKLSKEVVASCVGTYAAIARAESITEIPEAIKEGFSQQPITDREVYRYSEEEIKKILAEVKEERRGINRHYWEDVNVGDELTPIVKEALTTDSLLDYTMAVFSAEAFPSFEINLHKWLQKPGFLRTNPKLGWPYDIPYTGFEDPFMGGASGMPHMFAPGSLKVGFCAHLLSDWMGDDGFIRKLKVDVSEPYIYHDVLWIKGKVVEKYKEKVGGELYGAVNVKISAVNQLGGTVARGIATVYLPFENCGVTLPIPQ